MSDSKPVYIISSCLLGLLTRYDGQVKQYPKALEFLKHATLIPLCPEQLGGFPTPREAADITGGSGEDVLNHKAKVLTKSGNDVSEAFILGAKQVLQIAQSQNIKKAILKARSPSCGVHGVTGVTTALLQKHHIETVELD